MSRLLDLLKAAAGEIQLSGPLGRFLRAVAEEASSSAEGPFVVTTRSVTVQSFAANGDVVLNQIALAGGIAYDTATGLYTLKSGKLYSLAFYGIWTNFGTPATDEVDYTWHDADLGGSLNSGGSAFAYAMASTSNNSIQPVSATLYRAPQDTHVKVSVVGLVGTVDLRQGAYAIVRQIG